MRKIFKRGSAATTVALTILAVLLFVPSAAPADIYLGGGVVVVKSEGQSPAADDGAVVCNPSLGTGTGGACLSFGAGVVKVNDLLSGNDDLAFQVCIDNDGDSSCTSGGQGGTAGGGPCADFIAFSHDDAGRFFNPLGPLPTSKSNCPTDQGKGWNGYVVFMCEGVHAAKNRDGSNTPHTHPSSLGMITLSPAGSGEGFAIGDGAFCGGTRDQVSVKDYQVISIP